MSKQDLKSKLHSQIDRSKLDSTFDSMFGLHNSYLVKTLPINSLIVLDQPFKPYTDEKLEELADDIAENGLLNPIIVRPVNERYQVLAGRNRMNACKLNGHIDIPAFIKECDNDTATMIMLTSNLNQRQRLLPSEKAFAYKMQMDILKKQGKRTDLESESTSTQVAWRRESAQELASQMQTSRDDIRRHIRLTYLLPEFLDLVDKDILSFIAGVNLSYLTKEKQGIVRVWLSNAGNDLTVKQSAQIRQMSLECDLTEKTLQKLFSNKAVQGKSRKVSVSIKNFTGYEDVMPKNNADFEILFREFLEWRRANNEKVSFSA